jgi:two-component system OmpR family response regulator
MKLLLVEDDLRIASIISRSLKESSYAVDHAVDSQMALDYFAINDYDLVILDILIPGSSGNGFSVCQQIRIVDAHIPILMLTALDSPLDRVRGLDMGADDYLVKPFHLEELQARIRALLRRTPHADSPVLQVADVVLNTATKIAYRGETAIKLSAKEYALLEYLMKHAGNVVNQTELLEHVWDSNYDGLSNIVETYIRYLRKKLSPSGEPNVIQTRRGLGYVIGADSHV